MMRRFALPLAAALLALACGDDPLGPTSIEDTKFAPELGVDLSASTRTQSGLYYRDLQAGEGSAAAAGDSISVHYTGWLPDGTKFDSSYDRDRPFAFRLGAGRVIAGWDEGLQGVRVGGVRQLVIPSHLAYGPYDPDGANGPIGPHANLVFEVTLVAIH